MKHTSIFKGIGIIQNAVVAQAHVFTSFYHFCYAFSGGGGGAKLQHNYSKHHVMQPNKVWFAQSCLGMCVVKFVAFAT